MLRTVLPALAHAVVVNSRDTVGQEGKAENLKAALQVHSGIICVLLWPSLHINMLFYYSVYFVMVDIIFLL
jgi:hypothetical protein